MVVVPRLTPEVWNEVDIFVVTYIDGLIVAVVWTPVDEEFRGDVVDIVAVGANIEGVTKSCSIVEFWLAMSALSNRKSFL